MPSLQLPLAWHRQLEIEEEAARQEGRRHPPPHLLSLAAAGGAEAAGELRRQGLHARTDLLHTLGAALLRRCNG